MISPMLLLFHFHSRYNLIKLDSKGDSEGCDDEEAEEEIVERIRRFRHPW